MFMHKLLLCSVIWTLTCGQHMPGGHPKIAKLSASGSMKYADTNGGCPFAKKVRKCGNSVGNIYSKINGTCNNPISEAIGSSQSKLKRLLPADYADGVKAVRRAGNGEELPNARHISNMLQNSKLQDSSSVFTHMFVQFGQFLTHDIVDTPKATDASGQQVECDCASTHPECMKIDIPKGDKFLGHTECMAMTRSKEAPGSGCNGKAREHLNTITSFIDGSAAYASDVPFFRSLRDFNSDGLMKSEPSPNGDPTEAKLPSRASLEQNFQKQIDCPGHLNPDNTCFAAGEHRVNENIGLSTCHAVFIREHNRIATEFKMINPSWNSEKIFQETRRIISAVSQVTTYKEFLPALVGNKFMKQFSLNLLTSGYYYGYDSSYDSSISNAFTTAAFRYGHSMVNEFIPFLDGSYTEARASIEMHKTFFNPELVIDFNNNDAHLMRGLIEDVAKNVDNNFVEEIRSKMFLSSTKSGRDLFAINIHRGRDHGLPSYNKFRHFCGLREARIFSDFSYEMPMENTELLSKIYDKVEDVDLFVGGLSESPLEGAAVGPTFACIIAYQFRDLRKGDRFWFENPDMFSEDQLQELRKASFSRLMCDNVAEMETIQPDVMYLKTVEGNSRVNCNEIPQINLNVWKDKEHVVFNKDNMEWTRWFIKTSSDNVKVLANLRQAYHKHVCAAPLDFEEQEFVGRQTQKSRVRIRFLCPLGTVSDINFPNTAEGCEWTLWYDRHSPSYFSLDDNESLASTRLENPDEICEHPVAIQARTVKGDLINTDETLHTLHPNRGLQCKDDDQPEGIKCSDYKVRYLCPTEYLQMYRQMRQALVRKPTTIWTQWLNINKPNSYGERETLQDAVKKGYNICRRPLQVEYRIATSPDTNGHQVLKRISPYIGLICVNADQEMGSCLDYEVRYLCESQFRF